MRALAQRWRVPVVALLLGGTYVLWLLATSRDLGYARDEGFYFDAARSYRAWFELLWTDPSAALTPRVVDRYWAHNREHPALMKSLFALSHWLLHDTLGWIESSGTAYRLPAILLAGSAVSSVYLWGRRIAGELAGLAGAALLAFLPRFFYHAHLACFDAPVASLWLITTYAYARSLSSGRWGWALTCGVLYGLLLNTKHNAWLLPPVLVLHSLLLQKLPLRAAPGKLLSLAGLRLPPALLTMACLGPVLMYLGWPWLWHDTVPRLADYVSFHTGHEYYNMEFLGQTYYAPPMPRLYAWVMTLATVPAITLALAALGSVLGLRAVWRDRQLPDTPRWVAHQTLLLWLLCILFSYAPWLSTETPIFGGTKHWITAMPYLCLVAGVGLASTTKALYPLAERGLRSALPGAATAPVWLSPALTAGVLLTTLTGPLCMTQAAHPFALSAYTPLVGGAPGAASLGLNRTFWGYTTGSLTDAINQRVPGGGTVYVHDTALQSFEQMKADGLLRSDLYGTLDIARSDAGLYHHEPHMGRVEYQLWVDYGTTRPANVVTHHGVPVVWLYERQR